MKSIKIISIKSKLIAIILSVTLLTIISGFTVDIIKEYNALKSKMINESLMSAKLVSEYCITPLDFNYIEEAETNLSKLDALPIINNAYLFDADGRFFASYNRYESISIPEIPKDDIYTKYEGKWLHVFTKIKFKDEIKGTIYLKVLMTGLYGELINHLIFMLFIGIGMMAIAYFFAVRMQKYISKPILTLAEIAKRISNEADYSIRMEKEGDDEIGTLYDSFNNMLEQINMRESERDKAEESLIKALEKATESDRLKSTFLASMSHELRTPLNAIIGFSDIVSKELPIDRILEFTKTINMSGNHLLSIVNDLFDITLIEAGQIKIKKNKENLNSILKEVHEVVKTEQQIINKNNIDLNLIIPPKTSNLIVNTDSSKLKQVLINLLKNALKFTNEGHVHYGYTIEKYQEQKVVSFYVKDTGIGIPENKRESVFDIFRQAQESYTKTHGGTGIGLTISKKLIELMGGKIWLKSEVENPSIGKKGGTSFYFIIPFDEGDNIVIKKHESAKVQKRIIKDKFKNKTVLIVEDVEASYEYLKVVLEQLGIKTLWAKDGKDSIQFCEDYENIDLVLMDINMPVMNGYTATKEIRKLKPKLPIIAQTAYAIVGDRQKSIDAGCDDYISKPIKRDELLEKIKQYFICL